MVLGQLGSLNFANLVTCGHSLYKKLLPSGHPLLQKLFRRQSGQLLELSVKGSARTETGLRIDCVYIDRIVMRHQMDGIIYPVFGPMY